MQTIDLTRLRADFDRATLDRKPPRKVLRALEIVALWVAKTKPAITRKK
jgi:hypothetical protein